ncbi:MAG: RAMP superfamily CRISPR-associated protein, partial [Candidatus Caldarchaeum sp.]|nr:RAMP superfamily CRISPR-associated protein [Candidatus Caldarchaeum sp.]
MHLAELTSKIIAEIELVSQSHVHVGEHEPGSARLEVMRLYDGSFIVPSSTWKGCFRGLAEKLAPSLSLDDLEMLAVEAYGANGYVPKLGDERFRNYLEEMRDVLMGREKPTKIVKHGREELTLLLRDMGYEEIERGGGAVEKSLTDMALDYLALHCPIGRLFGNHVIASKLRFHHTVVGKEARTVE